jgi:hypothetical protein
MVWPIQTNPYGRGQKFARNPKAWSIVLQCRWTEALAARHVKTLPAPVLAPQTQSLDVEVTQEVGNISYEGVIRDRLGCLPRIPVALTKAAAVRGEATESVCLAKRNEQMLEHPR